MRRKSEKGKEKDRESPEKRSIRRSSRRHSKRRKHSHSSSPEADDSGAEDSESQSRSRSTQQNEKQGDNTDPNECNEITKSEQKIIDPSKSEGQNLTTFEDDWKEDYAFWSEDIPQGAAFRETMHTDECSQSVPARGKNTVLEPKSKRPKRVRRRSRASGCDYGVATADRMTRDDNAEVGNMSIPTVNNEEQSVRTENISDDVTEVSTGKRVEKDLDCVHGSDLSKVIRGKDSEVNLNEIHSEQERRKSTGAESEHEDAGEEKIPVRSDSVALQIVQEENTVENELTGKSNDTSGDKSEVECDSNSQKDICEDTCKGKEFEVSDDICPEAQINSVIGSDRETSEESVVQQDAHEGDSRASRAPSGTLRRSGSRDSADFQTSRQEVDHESSEVEKPESLEVRNENEKSASTKKATASSEKRQSEAGDSSGEASSRQIKSLQKTSRHQGRRREAVHSSAKSDSQPKIEEEKVKPKRIKLCRTSKDSNSCGTGIKESRSHSSDSHEQQRPVKLTRRSRSPESSQDSQRRESDSQEHRSPGHHHERILLRRSFSEKSVPKSEGDTVTVSHDEAKTDDVTDEKDNKENEKVTMNTAVAGSISRKRRWGASKTSRICKKPVLLISSDSLKNLIPGAKPLSAGEVQLTEDDNFKEAKIEKDESWTAKVKEEKELIRPLAMPPDTSIPTTSSANDHSAFAMRKISIVSDDARKLQRSPSPPKNQVSAILFITNLVRPFTVQQLKELLARTGTIVEGGFWIDKIKSKCYVQYETEDQARDTRHALHGVRWPISNPKQLCVDFGRREAMEAAKAGKETDSIVRKVEPLQLERVPPECLPLQGRNIPLIENWVAAQQMREKERDRGRVKDRPTVPPDQRLQKVPPPVREWDLGKIGQMSPEREGRLEERTRDRERKARKDKLHRSRSTSPSDISARKCKKKDDDAPAKLLDDLFRKTKTVPCIYWLPLTAEQIVVKEEMRRKHVAEHERRMAEMRKAERERERERARTQQRSHRRSGGAGDRERDRERERDRRSGRRRSASGSSKK